MIPVAHILGGDRAMTVAIIEANGNKWSANRIRSGAAYRVVNFSGYGEVRITVADPHGAAPYEEIVPEKIWWPRMFPNSKPVNAAVTAAAIQKASEG
jgi:hypothetical protein